MNTECTHCGAFRWKSETKSLCCANGQVTLPPLPPIPHILRKLFTGYDKKSRTFRERIRAYNSCLAFASLGANEDVLPPGVYCFRINGQIHHRMGHILPNDEQERPKFSQIYIHDTENEVENRAAWFDGLDRDLIRQLQNFLHTVNPYVKLYKHASDVIAAAGDQANQVKMVLKADSSKDARRYNLPQASEVAVILPNMPFECTSRDIVLYRKSSDDPTGQPTKRISELHPQYDPLHYVLLFPYGHEGWRIGIQYNGSRKGKVSVMHFYSYRLMVRQDTNIILYGGRLFQQFLVDQYSKMEGDRLSYLRFNQATLRAELYQGLQDAVTAGDTRGETVGSKIILPATFIGSPRSMVQLYQDAMGIVRKYGKPDLFITFTCNPSWPEITRELYATQISSDRPDLVARVFKLKLQEFWSDILKKELFGKVVAHVGVVEFQKRGLPHAHLLIILHQNFKPKSVEDIDHIVMAEIPEDPLLRSLVEKHMMHGPCGLGYPNSPCMRDNTCSKRFPKDFSPKTELSTTAYPNYQRRDNGVTLSKNGAVLDNRWVVPYNPHLLSKYEAHINVEICNSVTAVKYLYKYIYKGHDRVMVEFQRDGQYDEITRYLDARYVSASEACWRLFHFELQTRQPAIIRLAVHLPDQQSIVYREGHAQKALQASKDTTLTSWFKTNQQHDVAKELLYHEMPEHFTWNVTTKSWQPRKTNTFAIGRIYNVCPSEGERFYLRLLLLHCKGATSFEDLRTVDGNILCTTFRETCHYLGLLQNDDEWQSCLQEASNTTTAQQLRKLFSTIIIFCEPSDPATLWTLFKYSMSEDFRYNQHSDNEAENLALAHLQSLLRTHKRNMEDFGLPQPTLNIQEQTEAWNVMEERQKAAERCSQLNPDQKRAFDHIMKKVQSGQKETDKLFFIDGPGGSGKTFLYNTLLSYIRGIGCEAIAVASSGIAAELLEGGRTAHSTFKIPIPIQDHSTCRISKQSDLARKIKNSSLIVWDEAPMMDRRVFEAVSRSLCDILNDSRPFGGKVVVLGGDFRQILPVVVRGAEADIVNVTLNRSELWSHVQILRLTQNMRAQVDGGGEFQQWLQNIGNGAEPVYPHMGASTIKIPPQICLPPNDIEALITAVFPNIEQMSKNDLYFAERAILTTTNDNVDLINNAISSHLDSPGKSYYSADSLRDSNDSIRLLYPPELLNSLNLPGLPPHKLTLSVDTPVMLLRNLDPKSGLLNGTRLKVVHLGDRVIEAKFLTGRQRNERVFIPRITMSPSDTELPFQLIRRQFPLRPCYAMTINKSQGQTLPFVGVFLPTPVFSHGQLYVALSRSKSFHGIKVSLQDRDHEEPFFTENIVYKCVLETT